MIGSYQFSNKVLTELCHRLAVETDAGIDIRRTWQREAEHASGRVKSSMEQVRDGVAGGKSLAISLAATGRLFPQLFLEMVHVGEESGSLGRVFRLLESHYRRARQAEQIFLRAVAWPLFELVFAVVVIGALIWILGVIAGRTGGKPIDVLGFGLVGARGLVIYVNFVVAVGLLIGGLVVAMRRGALWTRRVQRTLVRLPAVGPCIEKICLARLAWSLSATLNTSLDLRRAVPLALRATGNDHYVRHTDQIVADVAAGQPLHVALAHSGVFPSEFLDALAVAEESGQTVESMDRLSKRYEEEAESAIRALATIFATLIGLAVMGIIVLLIFRLAGFYFGTINDALKATQ